MSRIRLTEPVTARLDRIATELEQAGRPDMALTLDRVSDRLDKEASIGSFLQGLLKKIPGLPTKEQAIETLKKFIGTPGGEGKLKQIVEKIKPELQPEPGMVKAFDIQRTIKNLRGLANPMVIMSVLVLMGGVGKADAGPLMDMLKGKGHQEQTVESWQSIFNKQYKDADGGFIKYQGKDYRVGRGVSRDEQIAVDKAEMNARSFDAKSGESKTLKGTQVVKTVAKTLPNGSIEALVLMEVGSQD